MECQTVHQHLSAYLDRELPPHLREVLDHHFAHCPPCRLALTQFQTMTAWVREFPPIAPSPLFLRQVTQRTDHLMKRSAPLLFRRLIAAFPMQVAAGLMLAVSLAVLWQVTPQLWRGQQARLPMQTEPWLSQDNAVTPAVDTPASEPLFEEPLPAPIPLVQGPLRRPVFMAREEPWRMMRDVAAMPMLAGPPPEGRVGELASFPSFVLRAIDPVQTAQQVWEIVPRLGGALLQAQGMATPAGQTARWPVKLTLSLAASRYQALLDAIHQLPDTSVVEERMALLGRELSLGSAGAFRHRDYSPAATTPQLLLSITILPR